jgi:hypothetical protein
MRTLSYSLGYIRRDPDMVQADALEAWLAEHFLEYEQVQRPRDSAKVVAHICFAYQLRVDYRVVADAAFEVDRWYNLIDMSGVTQKQALVLGKLCFVSVLQILVPEWIIG